MTVTISRRSLLLAGAAMALPLRSNLAKQSTTIDTALALGRRSGVSEIGSQFKLRDYLVDPLPMWNAPIDYTGTRRDWGMAENGNYGTCVPAADYHLAVANAQLAGEVGPPIPDNSTRAAQKLLKEYFVFDHEIDAGIDMGEWLLWRCDHWLAGLPPIGGFVQINLDDPEEYQSALHLFGGVLSGVMISYDTLLLAQNNLGAKWTSTSRVWSGAHCITHLARNADEGKAISWGIVQPFSWDWWHTAREESYVVLTREAMNAPGGIFHGVNVAQLQSDLSAISWQPSHIATGQ